MGVEEPLEEETIIITYSEGDTEEITVPAGTIKFLETEAEKLNLTLDAYFSEVVIGNFIKQYSTKDPENNTTKE